MKTLIIILVALLVNLAFLKDTFAGNQFDTSGCLPSLIDLNQNSEGVITIKKPADLQWLKACAVADMNNDGYDDVVAIGSKNYNQASGDYTPVIYIIYGTSNLAHTIDIYDPEIRVTSVTWQSESNNMSISSLDVGDIDGDGKKDIVFKGSFPFTMDSNDDELYVIPGNYLQSDAVISVNTPNITRIYANIVDNPGQKTSQGYMGTFKVADINMDGKCDILFTYPHKQFEGGSLLNSCIAGQTYILYGDKNLPLQINAENTTLPVTKIKGDTAYMAGISDIDGMAIGDIDGDNKPDIMFPGADPLFAIYYANGGDVSSYFTVSYIIYNSLFGSAQYRDIPLDLHENIWGMTKLTRRSFVDNASHSVRDDIYHCVGIGDINGDGFGDAFIGYTNKTIVNVEKPIPEGYIIFGSGNFILSGVIDRMGAAKVKFTSTIIGEWFPTKFVFGDLNADGFQDCMLGSNRDGPGKSISVLYGRPSFPDSFQLNKDLAGNTAIGVGMLVACGDVNNDFYDDIIGNKITGDIFIVPGHGKTFGIGENIVKSLPASDKSKYTFSFADNSKFHFQFTKGKPSSDTKFYLSNLGNHLPDSLQSIPTSQRMVSFIQTELTNMSTGYTYRVKCAIDYTDSALTTSGINEQDLTMAYWDVQSSKWEKVQTIIDTTLNRATFETEHLSLFALVDKNDSLLTGVQQPSAQIPLTFELSQNYPNPFNPVTTIRFQIPKAGKITLRIYNILGQEVKTVISKRLSAGAHEVQWDGTNNFGNKISSGIYIYRMETNAGYVSAKKMVYLK